MTIKTKPQTYTPGPWTNYRNTGVIARYELFGKQDIVARTERDNPDEAANARLIAAAPELLEAAKEVEKWWKQCHPDEVPQLTFAQVRDAIAKAENLEVR